MGRSSRDSSRVTLAWEAIRRKLGNLVTTTVVRQWSLEDENKDVQYSSIALTSNWGLRQGAQETDWCPDVQLGTTKILPSLTDAPDLNFATIAVTIQDAGGVQDLQTAVHPVVLPSDQAPIHKLDVALWSQNTLRSWAAPVHSLCRVHLIPNVSVTAPIVLRLTADTIHMPQIQILGKAECDRFGVPRFAAPTMRSRMAVLGNVPFTRSAEPVPANTIAARAFLPERRQLAAATETPFEDLALIGVFRQVPITAVRKLELDAETATLQMWLKPDLLRPGTTLPFLNLVIGRRRSTGKIVQTVVA